MGLETRADSAFCFHLHSRSIVSKEIHSLAPVLLCIKIILKIKFKKCR